MTVPLGRELAEATLATRRSSAIMTVLSDSTVTIATDRMRGTVLEPMT